MMVVNDDLWEATVGYIVDKLNTLDDYGKACLIAKNEGSRLYAEALSKLYINVDKLGEDYPEAFVRMIQNH